MKSDWVHNKVGKLGFDEVDHFFSQYTYSTLYNVASFIFEPRGIMIMISPSNKSSAILTFLWKVNILL